MTKLESVHGKGGKGSGQGEFPGARQNNNTSISAECLPEKKGSLTQRNTESKRCVHFLFILVQTPACLYPLPAIVYYS